MKDFDRFNLDYKSLKALVTIVEQSSLNRAAVDLQVSQSTLSHTVDRLRNQLGDPLFYRSGRSNLPTPYLLSIIPRITELLSSIEGLQKREVFDPSDYSGELVVAANVTELLEDLAHVQAEVMKQTRARTVRLQELGPRGQMVPKLSRETVDAAISIRPNIRYPELRSEPLFEDRQVIFFDPSVRAPIESIEEYAKAKHIVLDFGGHEKSNIDSQLESHGIVRDIVLGVPNVSCLHTFIQGTDKICTMQSRLSKSALSQLDYCDTPFSTAPVQFEVFWHARNALEPMTMWLKDLIIRAFNRS